MTTPINIETVTAADVAATMTPPKARNVSDARIDLAKLRLPQHFTAGAVEKFITTIPIRKPDRFTFIRVHPDETYHFPTLMFDLKEERETYLVDEPLRDELAADLVPKIIFPAITRQGVLFLWPVRLWCSRFPTNWRRWPCRTRARSTDCCSGPAPRRC
jgi:hypothetical protein